VNSKFSNSDEYLLHNISQGKMNLNSQSSEMKPLMEIAWEALSELDGLIEECISTEFHLKWTNVLKVFRIAQGIRADLIEALLLTEKGFYSTGGTILRSALENATVMIAVTQSDELMDQLNKDTLKTTRCLSVARRVFEDAGKRYGFLTEFGVHQHTTTLGQNLNPLEDGNHELLRTPEHNSFTEAAIVPLTNSILHICFMTFFTTELAFKTSLPKLRQINDLGDNISTNHSGPITTLMNTHHAEVERISPILWERQARMMALRQ